jgi:hypothetical protein
MDKSTDITRSPGSWLLLGIRGREGTSSALPKQLMALLKYPLNLYFTGLNIKFCFINFSKERVAPPPHLTHPPPPTHEPCYAAAGAVVASGESDAAVSAIGGETFFGKTLSLLAQAQERGHLQKVRGGGGGGG